MTTRRTLLAGASAAGALLALRNVLGAGPAPAARAPAVFGPLQPDPGRILELPKGFSYQVISRTGALMADGLRVPGGQDGMAAFDAGNGRVALVCNHELTLDDIAIGPFAGGGKRLAPDRCYDAGHGEPCPGGTTTIHYDPRTRSAERQFLSLAGTERNCAGGATPWGSWLSCEETVALPDDERVRSHGWVFEVPATSRAPVDPIPLKGMGRFNHEAVAIDPRTGIAYMTEDRPDGLMYRFIPNQPGRFAAGGRLQALALHDWSGADTRNQIKGGVEMPSGRPFRARWIDLVEPFAPKDDLRMQGHATGAALFARGEGMCLASGAIYFACTAGGRLGAGQIFRYRPADNEIEDAGELELFVESTDRKQLDSCDNLTGTPWGDLLVCEDTHSGECSLVGITPTGGLYRFAENAYSESEFAGACFAPDGKTLFVNMQEPGLTLAITGPFPA